MARSLALCALVFVNACGSETDDSYVPPSSTTGATCTNTRSNWTCEDGECQCTGGPRSGLECSRVARESDELDCDAYCDYCVTTNKVTHDDTHAEPPTNGGGSDNPVPSGSRLCVAGNASSCYDANEEWTGSLCCVSDVTYCVDGNASSCYDAAEHWTGAKCCVEGVSACVDGNASSCYDAAEHWTGAKCCVEGVNACVDGNASSCYDVAEHWTGAECCVEGVSTCVDGNASSCYGNGEHWTGAVCCVD